MVCPKCGKEMIEGNIPTIRERIRFVFDNEELIKNNIALDDYFYQNFPDVIKGRKDSKINLSEFPFLTTLHVKAFCCLNCKQVVIPINEDI